IQPRRVDFSDQRIQWDRPFARSEFESGPEHRFKADGGRRAGDEYRLLARRSVTDRRHQYMCWPPLIDSVDPVMNPAFSSTRTATPREISSALPRRLTGIRATILPSTSSGTAATMSVSI